MKKILNEWRKFILKESFAKSAAPNVEFSDEFLEPEESLFVTSNDDTYQLVMYRKQKGVDDFYVMGYASVDLLTDAGDDRFNCIPNTYQISAIYVEKELQGKRHGSKLYSLAFAAIPENAGLTSDKYSGSEPVAKKKWQNMSNSSAYEKRKTKPKGNDKFDYDGKKTPDDKMDDCYTDTEFLGDKNATHHSLKPKNNSEGEAKFVAMTAQHQQNDFKDRADVEYRLLDTAITRFGQIFSKQVMGF